MCVDYNLRVCVCAGGGETSVSDGGLMQGGRGEQLVRSGERVGGREELFCRYTLRPEAPMRGCA